jgi:hypothetical protein
LRSSLIMLLFVQKSSDNFGVILILIHFYFLIMCTPSRPDPLESAKAKERISVCR